MPVPVGIHGQGIHLLPYMPSAGEEEVRAALRVQVVLGIVHWNADLYPERQVIEPATELERKHSIEQFAEALVRVEPHHSFRHAEVADLHPLRVELIREFFGAFPAVDGVQLAWRAGAIQRCRENGCPLLPHSDAANQPVVLHEEPSLVDKRGSCCDRDDSGGNGFRSTIACEVAPVHKRCGRCSRCSGSCRRCGVHGRVVAGIHGIVEEPGEITFITRVEDERHET
mmetsp:Transcript_14676/g.32218  ORF Transcript_14676/g.32218 Transcript_14676/m.32218 type:complete len:227 (+) Transcript_14676:2813-3493(+)